MGGLENYISSYFGVEDTTGDKVSVRFKKLSLGKGEFYSTSGSRNSSMGFVQSGLLRLYVNEDGKEITQWISTQGDFVADLSNFMFDLPARWNIQALEDCEIYTITKSSYQELNKSIPDWSRLEKLFLSKCFITLENRVYTFLSKTAEERYEEFFKERRELLNQVPLQYIASMLGMSPETLSRIRAKKIS